MDMKTIMDECLDTIIEMNDQRPIGGFALAATVIGFKKQLAGAFSQWNRRYIP